MKDLYFTTDLVTLLRQDRFYGTSKNLAAALRKFGLTSVERSDNVEQMYRSLAVYIMDQGGETEPFLSETFIYPEGLIKLFKEQGLAQFEDKQWRESLSPKVPEPGPYPQV